MRNQIGEGCVPCAVSNRWLYFFNLSEADNEDSLYIVDVMTMDKNGEQKKLCELKLYKKDILHALAHG